MLIGYLMAKWAASIGFFFTMLWGYNWHMMVGRSAGFVRLQNDIKWLLILSTSYCGYKQQFRVYGFVQKLDLRMGNDDDDGDDDWGSSSGIGIGPLKKKWFGTGATLHLWVLHITGLKTCFSMNCTRVMSWTVAGVSHSDGTRLGLHLGSSQHFALFACVAGRHPCKICVADEIHEHRVTEAGKSRTETYGKCKTWGRWVTF